MTLLIVGGSGLLGAELVRQATAAGRPTAATFMSGPAPADRTDLRWYALDLRVAEQIDAVVAEARPRVIVNATSGKADWAVTADGPVRLAVAAARHGCRLVHVSSDAVFSGARVHYDETCLPDPVTPYGAAKAAAETGVRLLSPKSVVARTSLIVDGSSRPSARPSSSPHVRVVHDLATGVRDGVLFTDDVRCPVHVSDLAAALLELAHSDARGVHHLAGADAVSRYELGLLVARRDGLDSSRLVAGLRADSPLPGALDVRLDCRTTRRGLRTTLRGARTFLAAP
ncbi:SDR family oxidoreductase [Streptomyces cavernicola]|uniref:Sugar nucleotide-binding protein n=1 Tax=Streptomyces cavernicola TaxID=3043613 RepID=A0ABT6S380_9ACTN|nr:sugar nucleotide-binding protein [Streptomyces sp. B-S-A6]MDI3402552.1 sugar nucleotide-binding protein [Streptomyces sp. B-S-A6]